MRDVGKYERMLAFARRLPSVRRRLARDLRRRSLSHEKVLAAIVSLLDSAGLRVGNEQYRLANHSHGLTTLRDRHLTVAGGEARLSYIGKSGQRRRVTITSRRLANVLRRCQQLPGQQLFQYVDERGDVRVIGSEDVNAYVHEAAGELFTAKDFRSWRGSVCALVALAGMEPCRGQTQGKRVVVAAVKQVAEQLGNRPATCRKYYIHPAVIDGYLGGRLGDAAAQLARQNGAPVTPGLTLAEKLLVKLLRGRP